MYGSLLDVTGGKERMRHYFEKYGDRIDPGPFLGLEEDDNSSS